MSDAVKTWVPLKREQMAERVARDIPGGWYVNLGIGVPTLIADQVPPEREVVFHSENGILGMGRAPAPDEANKWLINAGKQHVTLQPGASYFHHADSFAMIRGRRQWDLPVLAQEGSTHVSGLRPRRAIRDSRLRLRWMLPSASLNSVGTLVDLISRLNTEPVCAPVNTSRTALQLAAHDSGSSWVATPSMQDSFILSFLPVYPGVLSDQLTT